VEWCGALDVLHPWVGGAGAVAGKIEWYESDKWVIGRGSLNGAIESVCLLLYPCDFCWGNLCGSSAGGRDRVVIAGNDDLWR